MKKIEHTLLFWLLVRVRVAKYIIIMDCPVIVILILGQHIGSFNFKSLPWGSIPYTYKTKITQQINTYRKNFLQIN